MSTFWKVSYLIISEKEELDNSKNKTAFGGAIYGIFKAFSFLEPLCFFVCFLSFFFQVPVWCYQKGTEITKDCSIDQNRVEYYTTKLLTFEMWPAYFISWGCQIFLVLNMLAGVFVSKQRAYIIRAFILFGLLLADIFTGLLFMYNIWNSGLNSYFKIAFIILYSQTLRKGMMKLINGTKDSSVVLLVFVVNLLVWSGITYIIFFGTSWLTKTLKDTKTMQPSIHIASELFEER